MFEEYNPGDKWEGWVGIVQDCYYDLAVPAARIAVKHMAEEAREAMITSVQNVNGGATWDTEKFIVAYLQSRGLVPAKSEE